MYQPISDSPSRLSVLLRFPIVAFPLLLLSAVIQPALAEEPNDPAIQTVFIILMENKNWSQIHRNPQAPYINDTLLPMASYAEQYYNPPWSLTQCSNPQCHNPMARWHPSLPNYIWLEAGSNLCICNDELPTVNHQSTTDHLVTLLNNAGISWKSYQEDILGTDCPLTDYREYATRHNPMVYFDDVTKSNDPGSAYCIEHVRPYTELETDLENDTVACYNFITPNLCNDMHDCSIRTGDTWLANEVPKILNSQAYQDGGALFITWDEGDRGPGLDGPIGMIILSPYAKGNGYSNQINYTHSSTLRTIQEIFQVGPFLGGAAKARDLSDLFRIPLPNDVPNFVLNRELN